MQVSVVGLKLDGYPETGDEGDVMRVSEFGRWFRFLSVVSLMLCGFSINLRAATCAAGTDSGLPGVAVQPVAPVTPQIVAGGYVKLQVTGTNADAACSHLYIQWGYLAGGSVWTPFPASGTYPAVNGATIANATDTVTGPAYPASTVFELSNIPVSLNGLTISAQLTDDSGQATFSNSVTLNIVSQGWLKDSTGSTPIGETFERSVLLPSGHVLALGNSSTNLYIDTTPGATGGIFDTWGASSVTLPSVTVRPAVNLLPTGEVLVTGGLVNGADTAAAYVFAENNPPTLASVITPTTNAATVTPSLQHVLITPRDSHTATLMATGKVLIAGGVNNGLILGSTELFDPTTWSFTSGASLTFARYHHTATALRDGTVLVVGGNDGSDPTSVLASAELYIPTSNTWIEVGDLNTARAFHTATLLPDGNVLIAGGISDTGTPLNTAEIYDPTQQLFFPVTATMTANREQATATLMASGNVLIAGGGGMGEHLSEHL